MVVGDDVTVGGNDETGTEGAALALGSGLTGTHIAEGAAELLKEAFHAGEIEHVHHGAFHFALGTDVHHRGACILGQGHEIGEYGRRRGGRSQKNKTGNGEGRFFNDAVHRNSL